ARSRYSGMMVPVSGPKSRQLQESGHVAESSFQSRRFWYVPRSPSAGHFADRTAGGGGHHCAVVLRRVSADGAGPRAGEDRAVLLESAAGQYLPWHVFDAGRLADVAPGIQLQRRVVFGG